MKVVAFDGGTYRQGPVGTRLRLLVDALAAEGVEAELVWLEKDRRTGCYMCGQCGHKTGDIACSRPSEDGLRRCVRKIKAADAVVLGTPVYTMRPSPATQELLNRLDHDWLERNDRRLAGKVAAVVVDHGQRSRQGRGRGRHRQAAREGNGGDRARGPAGWRRGGLRERRDDRPGAGARRGAHLRLGVTAVRTRARQP